MIEVTIVKRISTLLLSACTLLLWPFQDGFGDSPGVPMPFIKFSANGKYVFVKKTNFESPALDEIERIGFPESGLYSAEDPTKPLWRAHFGYWGGVFVADNGINLVETVGATWSHSFETKVLFFYESGKVIRSYRITDLFGNPGELGHTKSNIKWLEDGFLVDSKSVFVLKKKDGTTDYFDFRTGEKLDLEEGEKAVINKLSDVAIQQVVDLGRAKNLKAKAPLLSLKKDSKSESLAIIVWTIFGVCSVAAILIWLYCYRRKSAID